MATETHCGIRLRLREACYRHGFRRSTGKVGHGFSVICGREKYRDLVRRSPESQTGVLTAGLRVRTGAGCDADFSRSDLGGARDSSPPQVVHSASASASTICAFSFDACISLRTLAGTSAGFEEASLGLSVKEKCALSARAGGRFCSCFISSITWWARTATGDWHLPATGSATRIALQGVGSGLRRRRGVEMNQGSTLVLAVMDLMRRRDRGQVILVHKLSVGQRGEQLEIEGASAEAL